MIQLHVWFNSPIYKSKVGQDSKSYFNFPIRLFNSQKKTVQYGITQNTNEKWSSLTFGLFFFQLRGPKVWLIWTTFCPFLKDRLLGPSWWHRGRCGRACRAADGEPRCRLAALAMDGTGSENAGGDGGTGRQGKDAGKICMKPTEWMMRVCWVCSGVCWVFLVG